jgi:hypothetical protein
MKTEYVLDEEVSQSGRIDIGPTSNKVALLRETVNHNPNNITAL